MTWVKVFERRRPAGKPFPELLPRERVVVAAPESCTGCESQRLSKVDEDVTETLEVIRRQWIQTVRVKFTCRDCEQPSQAPAPCHTRCRGAGRVRTCSPRPCSVPRHGRGLIFDDRQPFI